MSEWCLQHPWMTFFILVLFIEALPTVVLHVPRRKPTPAPTDKEK